MSAPDVSVVIPAYNAAAFIGRTLDSVRVQSYTNYEVIVVDDGSADDTQSVVESYFKVHGMAGHCIRQENKKIAGARNTGMSAACGSFIALLDHDDIWYPEKLEVVMTEFVAHPDADLICHNLMITRDGRPLSVIRNGPGCERMYKRLLFRGNALSPSASVFRKDKALVIGGFRENPAFNTVEDYDFWMRLSKVAIFKFITKVLGDYQLVERSASSRVEYHHNNLATMLQDHFRDYFGENPSPLARLCIRKRISAVYRSAARHLMFFDGSPEKEREFVFKMIQTYALDPKNVACVLLWVVRGLRQTRSKSI